MELSSSFHADVDVDVDAVVDAVVVVRGRLLPTLSTISFFDGSVDDIEVQ